MVHCMLTSVAKDRAQRSEVVVIAKMYSTLPAVVNRGAIIWVTGKKAVLNLSAYWGNLLRIYLTILNGNLSKNSPNWELNRRQNYAVLESPTSLK